MNKGEIWEMIALESTGWENPTSRSIEHNNKENINPHKLTWDDFAGKVDHSSKFHAHTYWKIHYSFRPTFLKEYVKIQVKIKCFLDRKASWVKPEYRSHELLNHEQGHYDIGCLCAREFKKRVKATKFSVTKYRIELKALFQKTLNEFLELEKTYDQETDHFKNKHMQKKWDDKLNHDHCLCNS